MNNSSAYANALLKSPVLNVVAANPAVTAPKRDYQSDQASADFHQAFKDVHDSHNRQDEKVLRSSSQRKATQAERHDDAKSTNDLNDAKTIRDTAAKQKPADDSTEINQSSIGNDVASEQSLQHKDKETYADKSAESGLTQEPAEPVTDINPDAFENTLMSSNNLSGVDIGVTRSPLAFDTALMSTTEAAVPKIADTSAIVDKQIATQETSLSTGRNAPSTLSDPAAPPLSPLFTKPVALDVAAVVPVTANSLTPEVIDSTTPISPLLAKSESVMTSNLIAVVPVEPNAITLDAENLTNVFRSTDTSVSVEKSGEVGSQPLVANESILEKNLSQQLIDNVQASSINQPSGPVTPADIQVLAAVTVASAASVKPLQPQVVLAEESTEVIELPTSLPTEAAASTKVAPASHSNAATSNVVNPEVTTAQVQMNASKTAFEKTLQAIVSPDASGADDLAALAPSSSSTSSSTNPSIDSLMRGLDQQTPAARSFVVQTAVPVPVGQPQWSQAVGEKVLWLAAQNVSSAEINLHPKDLGPIQVRVSVNQEQTTVSFNSQHAVVREVLDQNLNRLRDMFSEQGLNLVNVDVSDKSFSRQQGESQGQKGQGGPHDIAAEEETAVGMSAIVQQRLVDHYA